MSIVLPNKFWTLEDVSRVAAAGSFADLAPVGMAILKRMYMATAGAAEIGMVCGPISPRGGLKCRDKNLEQFAFVIDVLEGRGCWIFNQLPFEGKIHELVEAGHKEGELLEVFYRPLFESRMIACKFFQYNWQTSHGTIWELEQSKKLGTKAFLLSPPPECVECGKL